MGYEFMFTGQGSTLTDDEFALCRNIQKSVRELVASRDEYISSRGLDPGVFMPSGNWKVDSETHLLGGYRQLVDAQPNTVSGLRRLAAMYTGFDWEQSVHRDVLHNPNANQKAVVPNEVEDLYLYRYIDSLELLPEFLQLSAPIKFGEMGWNVEGKLVTYDSCAYLERLALMYEAGLFAERDKAINIIEIGAGYGGLAYYLKQLFPRANYHIVDLPESLLFSGIYLSLLYKTVENRMLLPTDGWHAYRKRDFLQISVDVDHPFRGKPITYFG